MKIPRRAALPVLAAIVILAGGVYVAIHMRPVERFVLAKAIDVANARTGAQIEIRRMNIHWTNLGVDLYGITVYGKRGRSAAPLLESPHLEIDLRVASLLLGKIGITKLFVDRPIVHFAVNDQGQTNLPEPPAGASASLPANPLFALAVRHVEIREGEIYYNHKAIPLSAELADFRVRIDFEPHSNRYKGFLRYDHGRVVFRNFHPIESNLEAHFLVSRSGLTVDPLRVSIRKSHITLKANLTGFANPDIHASYALALDTTEVGRILKNPSLPAGEITATGTLQYRNAAGPSVFDRLRVDGRFRSARLVVHAGTVRTVATAARGRYALERGRLKIADLQTNLLGGVFRMESGELSLTGRSPSWLNVTWQHASLKDLSAILLPARNRGLRVVGQANASANISWLGNIRRLTIRSQAKLDGQAKLGTSGKKMPLNALATVRYDGARNSIVFRRSYVRLGGTKLSLNGMLGEESNLNFMLESSDLHDFSALAIQAGETLQSDRMAALAPLDLRGSARFSGRVLGYWKDPRLQGRLSAQGVQVEGTHWRTLAANLALSSSEIALKDAVMKADDGGQLCLSATAGLRHWSLRSTSPLTLDGSAKTLSLATIQKLAKVNYPVRGMVSAKFSLQGTARQPYANGRVRVVKVSAWNQPIQLIAVDFRRAGSAIRSKAVLQTSAGALHADLTYTPRTMEYELTAHSDGIRLNRVRAIEAGKWGIQGVLALSATGRGTIKNPELSAILHVSNLRVRDQSIPNAQAKLDIVGHRANFTTQMVVDQGTVQAHGSVALSGEYDATATLSMHGLSLGTVLARYVKNSPPGLDGKADLHAVVKGPLKDPNRIECQVEVPTLRLAYRGVDVALAQPLRLSYHDGVAAIQKAELKGTNMDFTLRGAIPVGKPAPMNVSIDGTVNLGLLQAARGINSSGRLAIRLAVHGKLSHPTMEGKVQVENAALSTSSISLNLGKVNGQILLSGDRVQIQNLTGRLSGGTFSAQGFVVYQTHPAFNLTFQAKSVGVRYPQGLVTMLNCNLRFAGTQQKSDLSGRVVIDQLVLTKQFNLMRLASQFSSGPATGSPSPLERHVRLNVRVQSAQTLNLVSSQLSVRGGADLTLTGTLANPVVLGRATLANGEIFFLNRRYEIQSGTIEFSNPIRNNPTVNIYAATTVQQYKITMNFVGPFDRLRTNYTSDPPLPPADIIGLIAFGKTSEQAASSPVTPSVLGAESVLAKGIASQVAGKIQKLAGISQLTINPIVGGAQQGMGAGITVQQRVTGRLLITFSTTTTRAQDAAVQMQYEASHNISISGLRDQNGGYAVDIHFHKSF